MTDKQIIIDGEKITKEDFIDYFSIELTNRNVDERKEIGNKYFEIILRKEQECNQLKVENLSLKRGIEITKEADKSWISQLKAENDKLKAENKILKEKFEIAIKNNMDKTLLRLENGDVKEELQEIRDEFGIETLYCHDDNTRVHRCIKLLQLKDCLTEIKEMCEKEKGWVNCSDMKLTETAQFAQQIFDKISEVENG